MTNGNRVLLVIYVIGFFVTYGIAHKDFSETCHSIQCDIVAAPSIVAALTWPLYWPLQISVEVFK